MKKKINKDLRNAKAEAAEQEIELRDEDLNEVSGGYLRKVNYGSTSNTGKNQNQDQNK